MNINLQNNTAISSVAHNSNVKGISKVNSGRYSVAFKKITSPQPANYNPARNIIDRIRIAGIYNDTDTKYFKDAKLKEMVEGNPQIEKILAQRGLKTIIYRDNLPKDHLLQTANNAIAIAREQGLILTPESYRTISQAAILHDIGKVLIPESILKKKTELTPQEKEIIALHAELGYELLKNTKLDESVKLVAKNHHHYSAPDTLTQIIKTADMYSALVSKRDYKDAFSKGKALEILQQNCLAGKIPQRSFDALVSASCYL